MLLPLPSQQPTSTSVLEIRTTRSQVNFDAPPPDAESTPITPTRSCEMKLRRENLRLTLDLEKERRVSNIWKLKYSKKVTSFKILRKKFVTLKRQVAEYRSERRKIVLNQKKIQSSKVRRKVAEVLNISGESSEKPVRKFPIVSRHYRSKITKPASSRQKSAFKSIRDQVRNFYLDDENSSPSPRVADTVTRKSIKERKRFMTDTIGSLYKKYKATSENPVRKSLFHALRPFWVVSKVVGARETCLCRSHTNLQYMIDRLYSLKIVASNNIHEFMKTLCCDSTNKACVLRKCKRCSKKVVTNVYENPEERTWYNAWVTRKLERLGAKGKMYSVTLTRRRNIICSVADLIKNINNLVPKFFEHIFVTNHQFKEMRVIRENVAFAEAYMVIDFSQNYVCKYSEEIQSTHFGASKKQITLHTGGFYYKLENGERGVKTFVTVSESLRHDASAIWAHLEPIFQLLQETVPNLKSINIQSDGPSTQYKNKKNFLLFRHFCEQWNLQRATWNFTAAGHGKSVADAVGANVKSMCDRYVANGNDILSGEDVVNLVNRASGKIKAYLIPDKAISEIDPLLPKKLKAVPKTLSVHQIVWSKKRKRKLFFRSLSCNECLSNVVNCPHHGLANSSTKY